jgi:Ca2+-transporting ATPase
MAIPGRRYTISGTGYSIEGHIKRVVGDTDTSLEPFLQPMVLCSDAVVENGNMIGDPTEGALVVLGEKGGLDAAATRAALPRVAELPFDSEYKFMATFHRMNDEDGNEVVRCFVKGAPDQLLAHAGSIVNVDGKPIPLTDDFRTRYMDENERLAKQGLRVLATARKDFDSGSFDPGADILPLVDELTLLALVGIVDPARPEAKDAIATAKSAGIRVRMITGDHAVTAGAIAAQLGIEGRAITGAEWEAMSDDEALAQIDEIGVIARVAPEDKVRLVDTLKRRDEIVAMTGDGVNDAPALKEADIGIAMGITGTEVSKEAAVMILTDDNFATIVKAVELGRGLYDNLVRYIRFQIGALAGFIITFLGASIFNIVGGVPFLPLQTLWVNFTTQVFQSIGLGYGRFREGLMEDKPRAVDEPILNRDLIYWLAVVGLVHGVVVLGVLQWASDHRTEEIARTMAVTSFGLMNLFYSFTVRSELRSVFSLDTFEDRRFVIASIASFVAILMGAQMDVMNRLLKTEPLDRDEWLICLAASLSIIVVSELRKLFLRRKQADLSPQP